jgi:hypothetical protein
LGVNRRRHKYLMGTTNTNASPRFHRGKTEEKLIVENTRKSIIFAMNEINEMVNE